MELQRIAREGKRIRTMFMEVRAAASPLARSESSWRGLRIGLIVPRYKHSAVARNQVKRRLRELARTRMLPTGILSDVVLRIRPEAYTASFEMLCADIDRAVVQLKRWREVLDSSSAEVTAVSPGTGDTS